MIVALRRVWVPPLVDSNRRPTGSAQWAMSQWGVHQKSMAGSIPSSPSSSSPSSTSPRSMSSATAESAICTSRSAPMASTAVAGWSTVHQKELGPQRQTLKKRTVDATWLIQFYSASHVQFVGAVSSAGRRSSVVTHRSWYTSPRVVRKS